MHLIKKHVTRTLLCVSVLATPLWLTGCGDESDSTTTGATPTPSAHVFGNAEGGLVNGSVQNARFNNPVNVEVDDDGNVFVADFDNDAVRVITPTGVVSTLVKQANFQRPFGLTLSTNGRFLYVQTDGNDLGVRNSTTGTLWRVTLSTGAVNVVARNLGRPRGLQALPDGRIAMSDLVQNTVSLFNPTTLDMTLLAGQAGQAGFVNAIGSSARFSRPYGLALDSDGSLLLADQNNHAIRRITLTGVVSTVAGLGASQAGRTDGVQSAATFRAPEDVAVSNGSIYVADQGNHVIRRIRNGIVRTIAGNGTAGYVDADGTSAAFFGLEGIALTPDGATLWIADGNNGDGDNFNRVRYIPVN